jgi:3-deoxy-7-phosphoheptulonate synthase
MADDWSPRGWRAFEARQQPVYADARALEEALADFAGRTALVPPAEIEASRSAVAEAAAGRAFILQAGDCAESLDRPAAETAEATAALLHRLGDLLASASGRPVVRMARLAGQFAKPRSRDFETRSGTALPVYRGDAVNGAGFEADSRKPDPSRLVRAFDHSLASLAVLRRSNQPAPIYTAHEALLLPYEEALVRRVEDRWYAGSGHFLWIGDRTRFDGSAHVEFARGLANPIGLKCGPSLPPDRLLRLLERLDPRRRAGRLTLIPRLGAEGVLEALPPLLRAVLREGHPVAWVCDPMHGNTLRSPDGRKTRSVERIAREVSGFFGACRAEGVRPAGLHLELTARAVGECTGGPDTTGGGDYETLCDPRLNPSQAEAVVAVAASAMGSGRSPLAA